MKKRSVMRKHNHRQWTGFWAFLFLIFISSCTFPPSAGQKETGKAEGGPAGKKISSGNTAAPQWPHEKSELAPDPALIFGKLDNGLRYVLMPNSTPKDRVSMHLHVQAGSVHEREDQQGLAHFLEHMLFNGSEHFRPGELVKYFQSIGMDFGPDANASTGFFRTVYDILLPKGDAQSIKDGLLVLHDYADSALLLESETDRERRVILSEMRARDSADFRTFVKTIAYELPGTLISQRIPIGKEEIIKKAGRKDLKDFYDTWYRPERIVLLMVGDFQEETAHGLIREQFSSLSPRAPPAAEPDPGSFEHRGVSSFYHHEPEKGNTEITIQVIERIEPEHDSPALQKKYLLRNAADRIVQNRLERLTRKADSPFTDASVSSGIYLQYYEYGFISADCSPEKWESCLRILEQTLRKALTYGFTEAEAERVKKDLLAETERAVKNAGTRESKSLARNIMSHLDADRVFRSPAQEKALYAPFIESLTAEEISRGFRETWHPDHRMILLTGNAELKSLEMAAEEMILSVYEESAATAVSAPEKQEKTVFPYLPDPAGKGKIVSRKEIADLGIIQIDFENGFRLNLKPTDFSDNEVLARLTFGPGQSAEPADKSGLGVLSQMLVNESGTGTLNPDALEQALAGKNTRVRFRIAENYFALESRSVPGESELLFQLLYAYLKDPGFREDAYALSMERFAQQYEELSKTIDGAMPLSGSRFLAGGDSRFGLPSYAEFRKLRLEDVKEWVGSALEVLPRELSLAGDFDPDTVIPLTARYFGSLPQTIRENNTERKDLPVFPAGKSLEIPVESSIPKGMVRIAWPTDDIWNISRTRRISILSRVYSDRLREVIREKLGATYSPYAYNDPGRAYAGYGVFHSVIIVNPADAEKVVREIREIVSRMLAEGISEAELSRAVEPTLTGIKDMRRENNYWLNTVLTDSVRHPEQIEWSRSIADDYASIRVEDVMEVAKQYLDNEKAAVIIARPEHP
ncbi:MAG: insulinase family protein [Desulfococcaceae bacterium]|nr:insulinase family protein [Desulfococcaceae bacterium]